MDRRHPVCPQHPSDLPTRRTRTPRAASGRSHISGSDVASSEPCRDERGEALPAAILFLGVLFTILLGVHVVIAAMARTAVQAAADSAVAAAQSAGPGPQTCDGVVRTARECAAELAARLAMLAPGASVVETKPPGIVVAPERGTVTVVVFGGTLSPLLGALEFTGAACGPLDDVPALALTSTELWQC